jgi:hypothetical protein
MSGASQARARRAVTSQAKRCGPCSLGAARTAFAFARIGGIGRLRGSGRTRVREPIVADNQFAWVQLDTEAASPRQQPSFHIFADAHADVRGEVLQLREGEGFSPAADALSEKVHVFTGLSGTVEAQLAERSLSLSPLSQLLVLPGVAIRLRALCDASIQVISMRCPRPQLAVEPVAGRAPSHEAIAPVSERELQEALARNAPEELQLVALAVALHEPDADRAFATCARLAEHPDFGVRGNAMLGFGHIARLHRRLDERALPMLEAGLQDPAAWVRGQADAAAGEVQMLLGWEIERLGA